MKVMVIVKASSRSEAGETPTENELRDMMQFNEELVKKGIMLAGEGLHSSTGGKRVRFYPDGRKAVIDGPFAETKELVAGFWMWKVESIDHAVELAKRIPIEKLPEESDVEIRQVFELADFGDAATPQIKKMEEELRSQIEKQKS